MKLDVHNLFLKDALDEIMIKFDECQILGDYTCEIIHGHKHGTTIRDFIRSDNFLDEAHRNGHRIISKDYSDNGVTIFQLKPLIKIAMIDQKLKSDSFNQKVENNPSGTYCVKCKEQMVLQKEFNWYKCPRCGKLIKR